MHLLFQKLLKNSPLYSTLRYFIPLYTTYNKKSNTFSPKQALLPNCNLLSRTPVLIRAHGLSQGVIFDKKSGKTAIPIFTEKFLFFGFAEQKFML
jgi:hypothetical protein